MATQDYKFMNETVKADPTTGAVVSSSANVQAPIMQPNQINSAPLSIPGPTPSTAPDAVVASVQPAQKSLQDYIKQVTPEATALDQSQQALIDRYNELLPQSGGKSKALAQEQQNQGIPDLQKGLTDLNNQILAGNAEYAKMVADFNQNSIALDTQLGVGNRAVLAVQQSGLSRAFEAKKAAKSAEIGLLAARAQAQVGNINTALQLAQGAVDAKYAPIEDEIKIRQAQLEAIAPLLSRQDATRAEALKLKDRDEQARITEEKAKVKENVALAFSANIQTKFTNKGGEFFRVADGKPYSSAAEFLADAGVKSFEEAYQKGLVTDITAEKLADMEYVSQLRNKYKDAGINFSDSAEEAEAKLQNSRIYQKEQYIDDTFTLGEGEIRYNSSGKIIASGPTNSDNIGMYTPKQLSALTKINENVSKNDTYSKTNSMRTYADNVDVALSQKNGLSDIAAINQFQKVIDEGAVTRDQDVKLIQESQSLLNTLKTKIGKLEKGDQLSDTQRNQMSEVIKKLYNAQTKALLNDPYIKAKTKEAELYGLTAEDTILSEIKGFDRAEIRVRDKASGQTGTIPANEYDEALYEKISFNSAGNASASTSKVLASAVTKTFPAGSVGGQCGDFVRKVVGQFGATYPTLGDSLKSKINAVAKYGSPLSQARVGSVIVTKENPTYGHVAYIIGKTAKGYIVAESNLHQNNEKVSYGRVIPYNSSKLIGVINPKPKTNTI